jgi:hypothetical protein
MATQGRRTKLERLTDAGLILDDLPPDHQAVVEALTRDEVDILVSIKQRLDAADKAQGFGPPPQGQPPHFATFLIY